MPLLTELPNHLGGLFYKYAAPDRAWAAVNGQRATTMAPRTGLGWPALLGVGHPARRRVLTGTGLTTGSAVGAASLNRPRHVRSPGGAASMRWWRQCRSRRSSQTILGGPFYKDVAPDGAWTAANGQRATMMAPGTELCAAGNGPVTTTPSPQRGWHFAPGRRGVGSLRRR